MTIDFIKFLAIVICFAIAITGRNALNGRDYRLLSAALLFTLFADFFLVILHNYPIGVAFFCVVQVLYNVRFGGKKRLKILPFVLVIPAVIFAVYGNILVAVSLVYAQLFFLSYAAMVRSVRKGAWPAPNSLLVFIGMTAFFLCDICVAIWNLGEINVEVSAAVANFANYAIWLFYAPSQICLALSARRFAASACKGELWSPD